MFSLASSIGKGSSKWHTNRVCVAIVMSYHQPTLIISAPSLCQFPIVIGPKVTSSGWKLPGKWSYLNRQIQWEYSIGLRVESVHRTLFGTKLLSPYIFLKELPIHWMRTQYREQDINTTRNGGRITTQIILSSNSQKETHQSKQNSTANLLTLNSTPFGSH